MPSNHQHKFYTIKSSRKIGTKKGDLHRVEITRRGTYTDAVCRTCGAGAFCGGDDALGRLEKWAAWHADPMEIIASATPTKDV